MQPFRLGDWSVEPTEGTVTGRDGPVRLEPKVMGVLVYLCRNPGQVVSKNDLLAAVWPDTHVQDVALSRGISELRRSLGDDAKAPSYIQTLPKRGYRVIAPVTTAAPEPEWTSLNPSREMSQSATSVPNQTPPPETGKNWWPLAILGLLTLASIVAWRTADTTPDPRSIAVSSFQNLSGDPETDYFGQGIAEDILTRLSQIHRLRVVAVPTEISGAPAQDIGHQLRVAAVLAGSVRRNGQQVRITARLVEATSGRHLWAESFDRNLADIFDIQREVTDRIAASLSTELSSQERKVVGRSPTARVTAYDTYLQAREQYRQYRLETNMVAIELYQRALELDPDFALAHAGLASACVLQTATYGLGSEWLVKATDAARAATVLDPDLPEAHNALGMIYTQQGRANQARQAFDRALELRPGYEEARHNAAFLQYPLGRWDAGSRWQSFPADSQLR